jgi:hypothetical protein
VALPRRKIVVVVIKADMEAEVGFGWRDTRDIVEGFVERGGSSEVVCPVCRALLGRVYVCAGGARVCWLEGIKSRRLRCGQYCGFGRMG